jgi:tetratricopeptide (TPR) repeat protein
VLDAQSTDDDALRGYAEALLWARHPEQSDSVYQVALLRRSGVAGLRLDYARMLMLTGKLDEAKAQIDEAELLKPGDGRVAAHRAWWANLSGDREAALDNTIVATEQYPDDAMVQAIATNILNKPVKPESYVPAWRYNTKESSFEAENFWDSATKTLLTNGLSLLSK